MCLLILSVLILTVIMYVPFLCLFLTFTFYAWTIYGGGWKWKYGTNRLYMTCMLFKVNTLYSDDFVLLSRGCNSSPVFDFLYAMVLEYYVNY